MEVPGAVVTPITMTVWDDDTTDEGETWMDGVIAQFEAAHAGVNSAEHPDRVVLQPNPTVRLDRHGKAVRE